MAPSQILWLLSLHLTSRAKCPISPVPVSSLPFLRDRVKSLGPLQRRSLQRRSLQRRSLQRRSLPEAPLGALSLAVGLLGAASLLACAPRGAAESPGIELGAPGTTWAAKNNEQRFGFMAAKVHPAMIQVFSEYDSELANFQCSNCHGTRMEQIDYAMPNLGLYSLPPDRPYDDAIDYDSQIAVFMMTKVTPKLQELLNQGEGPPTKVSCFSCHPVSE